MALDLSKWNPFKFARRGGKQRPESRTADSPPGQGAPEGGAVAAAWPEANRLLEAIDPFALLPGLFRSPLAAAQGSRWFGYYTPAAFPPGLDVVDDGDVLRITAELPGMEKKDLEILVEDGFLVLRGDKRLDARNEEKGCFRLERAFGGFQRVLPLPEGVDADRAEAEFADGVLTLRLPKKPTPAGDGPRKLEIR
jgi:HSP20 family protein